MIIIGSRQHRKGGRDVANREKRFNTKYKTVRYYIHCEIGKYRTYLTSSMAAEKKSSQLLLWYIVGTFYHPILNNNTIAVYYVLKHSRTYIFQIKFLHGIQRECG